MSLSLSLFFFLYSSCCVENYENWVQNFILLTLSLHSLYADAQGPLQKPLEDERISSRADTFCSRAGDSVVQGVPYVKGPQGSWGSHQDSAYLIRVAVQSMGRARSGPSVIQRQPQESMVHHPGSHTSVHAGMAEYLFQIRTRAHLTSIS